MSAQQVVCCSVVPCQPGVAQRDSEPDVGDRNHRGNAVTRGVLQLLGRICAEVRVEVRHSCQCINDVLVGNRAAFRQPDVGHRRQLEDFHLRHVEIVVQEYYLRRGVQRSHTMVGHHNDVHAARDVGALLDALEEGSQRVVHLQHGILHLLRIRAKVMAGRVDSTEVQGNERGPLTLGKVEPFEYLGDAVCIAHAAVVGEPIVGRLALRFASRPEHRCRQHAVLLHRRPKRLAQPPVGVLVVGVVVHAEVGVHVRVVHLVRHDSVRLRKQPCDDGIVVGEGVAREDWLHLAIDAVRSQVGKSRPVRSVRLVHQVLEPVSVKTYQQHRYRVSVLVLARIAICRVP
mmetsp:Transcript_7027/g.29859  ORF Transcript_7027/g.29859 Transcript_7027/m.29859 type:complete len:344 (+) Transcript_7027:2118-3149(+)